MYVVATAKIHVILDFPSYDTYCKNDRGYHFHRMKKVVGKVTDFDFFSQKSTLPTCPLEIETKDYYTIFM